MMLDFDIKTCRSMVFAKLRRFGIPYQIGPSDSKSNYEFGFRFNGDDNFRLETGNFQL